MSIPNEGDEIGPRNADTLPSGSKVREVQNGHVWTRGPDLRWWCDGVHRPRLMNEHRYTVLVVGTYQGQTLAQYQFRYADVCLHGAEQYSISRDVVFGALSNLEYDLERVPLGPGLTIRSEYLRNKLPTGSVVAVGDPDRWRNYGLFVKESANRWRMVMGYVTNPSGTTINVVSVPNADTPEWVTAPPTAESEAQVRDFKKRAYWVGKEIKDDYEWCPTYDGVVAEAGIDPSVR